MIRPALPAAAAARRRDLRLALWRALPLALLLSACATPRSTSQLPFEAFDSGSTHARSFPARNPSTCEAARRALLSQGYVIGTASAQSVEGTKSFQPEQEVHTEIAFQVVCAPEGARGQGTVAFASALQDRYVLRKSNSSASLGVGALGSVSLPFSASEESLVKVARQTITLKTFYDRFFALMERYLNDQPPSADDAESAAPAAPAASAAPAVPPASAAGGS